MKKSIIFLTIIFIFLGVLFLSFVLDPEKILDLITFKSSSTENPLGRMDYSPENSPDSTGSGSSGSDSNSGGSSSGGSSTPSTSQDGEIISSPCEQKYSYAVRRPTTNFQNDGVNCSLYLQNLDQNHSGNFGIEFTNSDKKSNIIYIELSPLLEDQFFYFFENSNSPCEYQTFIPTKNIC